MLKKIITPFFYPLSVIILLFIVGFLNLRRSSRRLGRIFIVIGMALLVLSSLEPITDLIVEKLETKYPPITEEAIKKLSQVKYICVLGAGTQPDPDRPPNSQLTRGSLVRLIEAVRLQRRFPEARLILSGGAAFTNPPEAKLLSDVAETLAVAPNKIIIEAKSKDTSEQAQLIKSIVQNEPVIVVTSAIHMPRSLMLFKLSGIQAIPAPTDYLTAQVPPNPIKRFFPSPDSLFNLQAAIHEYLGIAWIKIFR
ncbi:MAG: YdcF family protein [Syntrophales bacterium]|nr:YdcF family protein [Syntrophales bacterium]